MLIFLSDIALAQFIQDDCIVLTQNRIEIVLDETIDNKLKNKRNCIDSIFSFTQQSITQLEKNLLYKMSDKIHLIVFDQLNSFEKFKNYQLSEKQLGDESEHEMYFPIYIGQNFQNIRFQCRYATSYQFVQEYLYGLTYREKNDLSENSHIPNWLIEGFLQYFSGGINVSDFHKFEQLNNKGHFKNINFIPETSQPIFGTVLWYMFEKEKGKGFNSAFWYLIKYANSFEGSFEYQFGIQFKKWLKLRIVEIQNFKKLSKLNVDIRIPQKHIGFNHLQSLALFQNSDKFKYYLLGTTSTNQNLILIDQNQRKELLNIPEIGLFPKLAFNKIDIYKNSSDSSIWVLSWVDNQWRISRINQFQELKTFISLENNGHYKLLKDISKFLMLINENDGISKIIQLNWNGEKKEIYSTHFKINDYVVKRSDGSYLVSQSGLVQDNSIESKLISIDSNGNQVIIYKDSNNIGESQFLDVIEESATHISFIQNVENNQRLIHLYFIDGNWVVKANNTKEMHYHQLNGIHDDQITEYFQNTVGIGLNRYNLNEAIYSQDTLKNRIFSFDTVLIANNNQKERNDIDSSNGYFISPFPINNRPKPYNLKMLSLNTLAVQSSFSPILYARTAGFRLSNEDLTMNYRSNIPLNETYNSIFTIFFHNEMISNNNRNKFKLLGFSSIDRNRIGLQFSHRYLFDKYTVTSDIKYRIRQFNGYHNEVLRNLGSAIEIGVLQKHKKFISFLNVKWQMQSDIIMNMDEFSSKIENANIYTGGLEFGIKTNSQSLFKRNTKFQFSTNASLVLNSAKTLDSLKNMSQLIFSFKSEYVLDFFQFKTKINAVYSLNNRQTLTFLGGSSGSLQQNQYTSRIIEQLNPYQSLFINKLGNLRGFYAGERTGSSGLVCQNEVQISPLNLFPSRVIETNFWKKLIFLGFLDFGTAFNGLTPSDKTNPYNTIIYKQNAYNVTVTANRNPYLYAIGYGVNFMVLGYNFRVERAFGFEENELKNRLYHFCIGKNF